MNRSTRTFIVVGVAVVAAAVASLGAYEAIRRMPVREVEVRSLYQVVAAHDLPMGSLITKDSVKLVPWPASSPVDKGFTTVESVLNRGLIDSVVANEPLTETKLASLEAGAGLPPSIPAGMRAVSVKVNEVIGVAGFVVPGTRVDVMVTLRNNSQQQDSVTRVVVSNVQVLTANTRYDQAEGKEGNAIRSTVVTLMVSPVDAERIALAQAEGQLMLTLRNPLDVDPTESTGVSKAALFGPPPAPPVKAGPRKAAAPPPPPPPAPEVPKPYLVETIRAAKRSVDPLQ